jgi:small subunit ribosomal protein S20
MAQAAAKKVKPRKKSVLKRIRQTRRRAIVNRAKLSEVRTVIRKFRATIASGDAAAAKTQHAATMSALDRAIGNGSLRENTANRYKSRLTMAMNAMKQ